MRAFEMEWEISKNWKYIQTKEKIFSETQYTRTGNLRKGAKPKSKAKIMYLPRLLKIHKQIVLEHNMWINRENPERQRQLIQEEIAKIIPLKEDTPHD
jgi:hypothetical protein